MKINHFPGDKTEHYFWDQLENYDDNGNCMSHMGFRTIESRYCGKLLNTVTVSGISTLPQYRRSGAVRAMMNYMFDLTPERGWAVSLLHPFSFSYYRMFGYDKVADHKILEFPITKLEFTERCPDFVPVNSVKTAEDAVKVYNEFSETRNIMFPRYGTWRFPTEPNNGEQIYLRYRDGKPVAYVKLSQEQFFDVNKMTSIALHIHEIAFTTPESLKDVFGFIRMFEGEDNTVKIHNAAMSPEIDAFLKHYTHTKYTLVPDLAGRILDVKTVLEANKYPSERGHFTVEVIDTLPFTNGVYSVEYQNGVAEAKLVSKDTVADVVAPMPAFTQLLYGYDEYDAFRASFLSGVKVNDPNSDFFKVFHKKCNGLFEHF